MKVFLFDADVIIWCAKNNKLDALFEDKDIKIPEVIYEQVRYIVDVETGEEKPIQLQKYIEEGSLEVIDNPLTEEMKKVRGTYKQCSHLAELDDGEAECITLLKKRPNYSFCSGDKRAIRVLGFLQFSEQAISLEEILGGAQNIRENFTRRYKEKYLKEGSELWVQYGEW
ncbi:MAG: hypothetical protein U9N06_02100 [candidate division WOR-3 bacterium]|nr:hypothetical protein [candidate division WOR-3 bacterium]